MKIGGFLQKKKSARETVALHGRMIVSAVTRQQPQAVYGMYTETLNNLFLPSGL